MKLIKTMTAETVFDLQALAERYRRQAVKDFVSNHPLDVMNSEGWRRMVDAHKALMTSDGLVAAKGDNVNGRKRPFAAEGGDGEEGASVNDDENDADVDDEPNSKRARG